MTGYSKLFAQGIVLFLLFGSVACRPIAIKETNEPDWYCEAFRPITWSQSDTEETIAQILEHNAGWDSLCH